MTGRGRRPGVRSARGADEHILAPAARRWRMVLLLALALPAGCWDPGDGSPADRAAGRQELAFVRGGVLAPGGSGGRAVGRGSREFVPADWIPGQRVQAAGMEGIAPRFPECPALFSVDLGDVARVVAMGGTAPDTALAFSPDAERLAVGSYRGELLVLDAWTGDVLARRRLAETMVKDVAFSPDGATLYAGEQSPDAFVHALDPATLEPRWSLRLAEEVGSSPAPDGEDIYGVYTLPSAYGLAVLPGGDLVVGATHGWNDPHGSRRNRARLLRIAPSGELRAAWPAEGPADAAFYNFRLDPEGGLIVVAVGRSAAGPTPPGMPAGGVQVLRLSDLSEVTSFVPEPLAPHFDSTFVWDALDVDAEAGMGVIGLGDGRVFGFPLAGGDPWVIEVSTPILAGDVPISASIGFGMLYGDAFVVETAGTSIPYSATAAAARPPQVHPAENSVFAFGTGGELRWTWSGPWQLGGLALGADGTTAVAGTRSRQADGREDVFGALLFRLDGEGSGQERLLAFCPTEGPVFFRPVLSADGRVAVAEHPWVRADGSLGGAYRVTVLR